MKRRPGCNRRGVRLPPQQLPGGAPAPPFDPTTIAGIRRWFDFSDSSTITLDGTNVYIDRINDKSGSGSYFYNGGTASRSPLLGVGAANLGINGLDSATFDQATTQYLSMYDASNLTEAWNATTGGSYSYTYFIVASLGPGVATNATTYNTPGIMSNDGYGGFHSGNATTPFVVRAYQWDWSATDDYVEKTGVLENAPFLAQMDYPDPGSFGPTSDITFRYNKVSVGTTASQRMHNSGITKVISLGRGFTAAWYSLWKGKIGEVLIYNQQLSGADITAVQDYLATKWGTP